MISMMIKKKKKPYFNIPNYGAKKRSRVQARWRKQRGVDNKKRTKHSFMGAEPTIGYKNSDAVSGIRASGKRAVHIANKAELMKAMESGEESFDIVLASALSKRKRMEIIKIAEAQKIKVANRGKL